MIHLKPVSRRIVYVVSFEFFAIIFSSVILAGMSNGEVSASLFVAAALSLIAIVWNYIYNTLFELWENKNNIKKRSFIIRLVHSIIFESGFILIAVPLFMWWYRVSFLQAFIMEIGVLLFFLIYTFIFTLIFDKTFSRAIEGY
ncbi:hypothetical protein CHU32_08475 [Superficieibacter electus]|uniref:Chlorhexidine efflux transporter domain-containing protein n=1 Tax=Superficieibacter electus TaxID=2022662 RepID=A0A2P5GRH9_9ENTR|nr:PACE efflux transporter [Superficieibacter electus]POP45833.1 hypothetical protein CHU33_06930 [Superficieibacter electus]POP49139.1 hypothetical protein CHU32_08475 [Superficieibacter electus]